MVVWAYQALERTEGTQHTVRSPGKVYQELHVIRTVQLLELLKARLLHEYTVRNNCPSAGQKKMNETKEGRKGWAERCSKSGEWYGRAKR